MESIEKFKCDLREIYEPILDAVGESKFKESSCVFCAQWGEAFLSQNKDQKFMVVGRAVNGWIHNKLDADVLFGNGEERIFNRPDQIEWVQTSYDNSEGYRTSRSSFWRVVKTIAIKSHGRTHKDWYSNVAWSNLFKVAPNRIGGNPNKKLRDIQRKYCIAIFLKELETLNPDVIIMFTGGWEGYFLKHILGLGKEKSLPDPIHKVTWAGKYLSKLYVITCFGKKRKFIVSEHPMGKKEDSHIEAILKLIDMRGNKYNKVSI